MVGTFIGQHSEDLQTRSWLILTRSKKEMNLTSPSLRNLVLQLKNEDLSADEPDIETPYLLLYQDNDGGGPVPFQIVII